MVGLLCLLIAVILLPVILIRRIRKKDNRVLKIAAGVFFAAGILLFAVSLTVSISSFSFLMGALLLITAIVAVITVLIRHLRKKPDTGAKITAAAAFVLCIVCFIVSTVSLTSDWDNAISQDTYCEVETQVTYDFEMKDGNMPIEVVDYLETGTLMKVYDSAYVDRLIPEENITAQDCIDAIESNPDISENYRYLLLELTERLAEQYPDADLRMFYHNLQTLKIIELSRTDYILKSLDINSLGCYFKTENAIYIPEGTRFEEHTFGYQVIMHEICHAAREVWFDGSNYHSIQFCSDNSRVLLEEAMNSVFSCSLLGYYEWDIAYQIPSNYLRIMLECMDNYTLSDYMNHSDTWFLSRLDAYTGYTNYAETVWKLITVQREDYLDDLVDIPAEDFEPIYDYLCDMYYKKYISADMTRPEAEAVADELVYKAFYDAPEEYKIDTQPFYDNLDNYIEQLKDGNNP